MMNLEKYIEIITDNNIQKEKLPMSFRKPYDLVQQIMSSDDHRAVYEESEPVQKAVQSYLDKFEKYLPRILDAHTGRTKNVAKKKPKITKKGVTTKTPRAKRSVHKKVGQHKRASNIKIDTSNAQKVEQVDLELKFIRRYVNMHLKEKSQNQIRLFLNAIQKAIVEKRIRKTSKFAKQIMEIQTNLIELFNQMSLNEIVLVKLKDHRLSAYLKILGKQIEMLSVQLIKSYVGLQGRLITNQQAVRLHDRIARAHNTGKITKSDKYWKEVEKIADTLRSFVKKNKKEGVLNASSKELNGLNGILADCGCDQNLSGVSNPVISKSKILSTTDIVNLNFDSLGFKGKWLHLIGDPTAGFSTMIFGRPKMGKSYLAVDLAQYLAKNHGTVLYIAAEEQITATFKKKLTDMKAAHPDFYVTGELPDDLSTYDFVFIDSVNNHGFSVEDLNDLEEQYPTTSFVYIFQTTKHGAFRGSNEFQHNVDVVIEIPEKGKAIQFGRFNQGGEIEIFNNNEPLKNAA